MEQGEAGRDPSPRPAGMVALVVGALGVVFGDIGTSPLYALPAAVSADHHGVPLTEAGVYGVISLVFWTITLVVSVKYVTFIMGADNDGEGGIMALIALAQRARLRTGRAKAALLIALGVFGAALFYGDGTITPAISVLSAIEGLNVAAPGLHGLVVPLALGVLLALFAVQRYGTGAVGNLFGPVMTIWFAAIALAGLRQVIEHPAILRALSPSWGVAFVADHSGIALVVLGAVVLTVTGAEALYADMGHFGRAPIRRAWFLVAFPALTLNYMGQGALLLHMPAAADNPFFRLIPHWGQIPMVLLATAATVIASQAVISGAFSITNQAVQLRFLPRLTIRHTSAREAGQVYAPFVNWCLCAVTAGLVVAFGSSQGLASAYGIAVTGTMAITTILYLFVARALWKRPLPAVLAGAAAFLTVDLTLFVATLAKVPHGGWIPLVIAAVVFTILTTWRRGNAIVTRNRIGEEGPLRRFVEEVRALDPPVHRVPGTGVFLNTQRDRTPLALRANVDSNHVLHSSVVILFIATLDVPYVDPAERLTVDELGYRDDNITHLTARFGFYERPYLPRLLALAARRGLEGTTQVDSAYYFLSRITIVPTRAPGMRRWRKRLFAAMARNEADPAAYYALPDERTVTIGSLIEL
jgi:KUP system potassium uptake protein